MRYKKAYHMAKTNAPHNAFEMVSCVMIVTLKAPVKFRYHVPFWNL